VSIDFIDQDYARYTAENHAVWKLLYERRIAELEAQASQVYLDGLRTLEIYADRVPQLSDINARLGPVTGWTSRAVPGYIPADEFFACLARRDFPTTISVRPREQLDYLPEPDIFHDVFGHVPMHANRVFGDFLQGYGAAALACGGEPRLTELQRLFWFTVEFGLIREAGRLKLYGSGLISSPGEGRHCLESPAVERVDFDLERVIAQPFEIDHYQPVLFVIDAYEQLYEALGDYRRRYLH
jgi:phenylalanine-4-hydroxylase